MKTKTFTKLLPIALVLMLTTTGSFATESRKAVSDMEITVPSFTQITTTSTGLTSTVTVNDNYENIQLGTTFIPVFKVYNNDPTVSLELTGSVTAGSAHPALYSTGNNDATQLALIFANTKSDRKPGDADVENIYGTAAAASNKNCFSLAVTPKVLLTEGSGAAAPTPVYAENKVTYPIKNGVYDFQYTFGTAALGNTFSTQDTDGTYQATLTLTRQGA